MPRHKVGLDGKTRQRKKRNPAAHAFAFNRNNSHLRNHRANPLAAKEEEQRTKR
jgi:hypothetical protein